jgi:hypothetical protein
MKRPAEARDSNMASPRKAMVLQVTAALAAAACSISASAAEIETGNPDTKIRWDNTLKYSAAGRLQHVDNNVAVPGGNILAGNPNMDDGDQNFSKRGLISNRVDLFSELDVSHGNVGARVSGAAWYDSIYNRDNHNPGFPAAIVNSVSVPAGKFTDATERLHGRKAELLDAFVYGKTSIGEMPLTVRAGRYTLLYGESLFMGGNGIANAQVPIDVVKALSVPNSQFKEIGMPVGQVSANLQLSRNMSVGAYYQLQWRKFRLPASGSYFSNGDFLDEGGETLLLGPGLTLPRGRDLHARDSGQGGAQFKFKFPGTDIEYGIYAARYHDKVPILQIRPAQGDYRLIYPENIKTFGASMSTVVGDTNISAEISHRRNTPLSPTGLTVATVDPTSDNRDNPAYPIGKTIHAQVSWIALVAANAMWDGASLVGEIGFNRRTSVDRNAAALDPHTTRDASGIQMIFEPQYFQVQPGIDLSVPIGISYAISGRSAVYSFGPNHGGTFSLGLNAEYQKAWKAGLQYTHYLGHPGGLLNTVNGLSFDQTLKDRDFISLSIQRSF